MVMAAGCFAFKCVNVVGRNFSIGLRAFQWCLFIKPKTKHILVDKFRKTKIRATLTKRSFAPNAVVVIRLNPFLFYGFVSDTTGSMNSQRECFVAIQTIRIRAPYSWLGVFEWTIHTNP